MGYNTLEAVFLLSFRFQFGTTAQSTNTLERSDSLMPGSWQVPTSIAGDGTTKTVEDTIVPNSGSHRFYRVRLNKPLP